ncbi:MAG: hypothetical protein JF603_04505 [Acidobacteria bacterium]|nr:hypothetical protein [Acidobacteriota bacterium]
MVAPTPSEIGSTAEREVAYRLHRAGWDVFVPYFAPHSRVDLLAGRDAQLLRVQCKTSRLSNGAVSFSTCSNTGNEPRSYDGEIDAFGVYSPELDRVFLVPFDGTPTRRCYLRLEPARNGQSLGLRSADQFVV